MKAILFCMALIVFTASAYEVGTNTIWSLNLWQMLQGWVWSEFMLFPDVFWPSDFWCFPWVCSTQRLLYMQSGDSCYQFLPRNWEQPNSWWLEVCHLLSSNGWVMELPVAEHDLWKPQSHLVDWNRPEPDCVHQQVRSLDVLLWVRTPVHQNRQHNWEYVWSDQRFLQVQHPLPATSSE